MKTRMFGTPEAAETTRAADERPPPHESGILWAMALTKAERACCCPAKPVVAAVVARQGRKPVELLFCRHHFLGARGRLNGAGMTVFDAVGDQVTDGDVPAG